MQIFSYGNTLFEVSNPVLWKKKKEQYHQFAICWISCEGTKIRFYGWTVQALIRL